MLFSDRVPLERGSSEGFRQREARAARLANEIEASSQYRHRVALENDEGRTEEDKYSAVVRDRDRDGGERERGRDSPGFSSAGSRFDSLFLPFHHLSYLVFLCSILMIAVFILGRASTFLYPREQGSEKWEFLEGAKEDLYPPCLIDQIDLAPQAPPLDPFPLVVVSPLLPLIGAALCLSEDTLLTNHRAAHLLSPAPQSQVTLALLPHTHSHIRSHTHSLSRTRLGLSMEVSFVHEIYRFQCF